MTIQTKPILFNAPMVSAILREIETPGAGKTQTRRIIKEADLITAYSTDLVKPFGDGTYYMCAHDGTHMTGQFKCPYGKPGDLLYVRENWQALSFGDCLPTKHHVSDVRYAATDPLVDLDKDARGYPWRPSIHMPRWASRITLEITDIRVERLQDIREADAIAEGVLRDTDGWRDYMMPCNQCCTTARESYKTLWQSINGPESWAANPWVWAVSFKPYFVNVDQFIKERAL